MECNGGGDEVRLGIRIGEGMMTEAVVEATLADPGFRCVGPHGCGGRDMRGPEVFEV